jgi:hypothetical protein
MSRVTGCGNVRVLALAALLAAAACQLPGQGPDNTRSAAADSRVLAADAKVFAGDYDGAESTYRALAKSAVRGAMAHLSTLLAYENRFQEAVAAAQAGVAQHSDSDSLARLTRALDWAQQVDAALAAGARAVAARPAVPLAHSFYAEALADAGRYADAERELRAAEAASGDTYAQAEVDREWANYHRSRGDGVAELNYTELAIKAQPGFAERQLDLIRYEYANQRPDLARTATDRLLTAHPKNYRMLVAAGDAALAGADGDRATSLFHAAGDLRADSPEAALGLAEIAVAGNRDFNGAHDLLLAALKRDPASSEIYEYLRYLDLLLLKRSPDAELTPIAPERPSSLAADRAAALDAVNALRSSLGLPALKEDPAVAEAAQAHAYFFLFNIGQPQLQGAAVTSEDASLPGFVAATAVDRARHFGYAGTLGGELMGPVYTPQAAVQSWTDSVFHRYPLLDGVTVVAGYGEAHVGALTITVMDVGSNAPGTEDPVAYPAANQTGVPPAITGGEVPDPLPQGATYPVGYPVTLQFGGAQKLNVTSGRLLGADGKEVPSYTLTPGSPVGQAQWAILARQPLKPGATYTAEVAGTVDGQGFSRRWSFTVARP